MRVIDQKLLEKDNFYFCIDDDTSEKPYFLIHNFKEKFEDAEVDFIKTSKDLFTKSVYESLYSLSVLQMPANIDCSLGVCQLPDTALSNGLDLAVFDNSYWVTLSFEEESEELIILFYNKKFKRTWLYRMYLGVFLSTILNGIEGYGDKNGVRSS